MVPSNVNPRLGDGVVTLRPPDERDVEAIELGIHDPDVVRWFGEPEADAVGVLRLNRRRWADGSPTFTVWDQDGSCVGHVWINVRADDPSIGSIGYWLLPMARGRGLATRAVRLVSVWAVRELGIKRLLLLTEPGNERSQRVAVRSGYRRAGILRAKAQIDGRSIDQVLFELQANGSEMTVNWPEIIPLDVGEFTFAADEEWAGELGVVVAYAIRRREGVVLFDTGFGFGSQELEERYHQKARWIEDVLGEAGIRLAEVDLVANCHLHADHAGQNARMTGVPIYVQPAELEIARAGSYTIEEWIDGPSVRYEAIAGDHELVPGVRIISTPGHAPGHQSLVVDQPDGSVLLSGQAVYGLDEWLEQPGREGRSTARDRAAYDQSLARLRALEPTRVLFAHDRRPWSR